MYEDTFRILSRDAALMPNGNTKRCFLKLLRSIVVLMVLFYAVSFHSVAAKQYQTQHQMTQHVTNVATHPLQSHAISMHTDSSSSHNIWTIIEHALSDLEAEKRFQRLFPSHQDRKLAKDSSSCTPTPENETPSASVLSNTAIWPPCTNSAQVPQLATNLSWYLVPELSGNNVAVIKLEIIYNQVGESIVTVGHGAMLIGRALYYDANAHSLSMRSAVKSSSGYLLVGNSIYDDSIAQFVVGSSSVVVRDNYTKLVVAVPVPCNLSHIISPGCFINATVGFDVTGSTLKTNDYFTQNIRVCPSPSASSSSSPTSTTAATSPLVSSSHSPIATVSPTVTPSPTGDTIPSTHASRTATRTASPSPSPSLSNTLGVTSSPTATYTATNPMSNTATIAPTNIVTPTISSTSSSTATMNPSVTLTSSATSTSTATATPTMTSSTTITPSPTMTSSATITPSPTMTSSATITPFPMTSTTTATPSVTMTSTTTATPSVTMTSTTTATPSVTMTPSATMSITPSSLTPVRICSLHGFIHGITPTVQATPSYNPSASLNPASSSTALTNPTSSILPTSTFDGIPTATSQPNEDDSMDDDAINLPVCICEEGYDGVVCDSCMAGLEKRMVKNPARTDPLFTCELSQRGAPIVTMRILSNFNSLGGEDSDARRSFISSLQNDLSKALNIPSSRFIVAGLREGSIIADILVLQSSNGSHYSRNDDQSPFSIVRRLRSLSEDPTSVLYSGTVTSNLDPYSPIQVSFTLDTREVSPSLMDYSTILTPPSTSAPQLRLSWSIVQPGSTMSLANEPELHVRAVVDTPDTWMAVGFHSEPNFHGADMILGQPTVPNSMLSVAEYDFGTTGYGDDIQPESLQNLRLQVSHVSVNTITGQTVLDFMRPLTTRDPSDIDLAKYLGNQTALYVLWAYGASNDLHGSLAVSGRMTHASANQIRGIARMYLTEGRITQRTLPKGWHTAYVCLHVLAYVVLLPCAIYIIRNGLKMPCARYHKYCLCKTSRAKTTNVHSTDSMSTITDVVRHSLVLHDKRSRRAIMILLISSVISSWIAFVAITMDADGIPGMNIHMVLVCLSTTILSILPNLHHQSWKHSYTNKKTKLLHVGNQITPSIVLGIAAATYCEAVFAAATSDTFVPSPTSRPSFIYATRQYSELYGVKPILQALMCFFALWCTCIAIVSCRKSWTKSLSKVSVQMNRYSSSFSTNTPTKYTHKPIAFSGQKKQLSQA